MIYEKGSFVVVPNLHVLEGKSPYTQTVFMWICSFTDPEGFCYPSMIRIAKLGGMSQRQVIRAVEELEELGVIKRTRRKKESKKNLSNLYQVMLIAKGSSDCESVGVVTGSHQGSDCVAQELYPLNSTNNNSEETSHTSKEFSFQEELNKLSSSKRHDYKVMYAYFKVKKMVFDNKDQYIAEFKRNLSFTSQLKGYTLEQILQVMRHCDEDSKKNGYEWKLSTVCKKISGIINR